MEAFIFFIYPLEKATTFVKSQNSLINLGFALELGNSLDLLKIYWPSSLVSSPDPSGAHMCEGRVW